MKNSKKTKIKFIDLFAGIGGFHKAFDMALDKKKYELDCVFVSEIDKKAIKTYSQNFNIKNNKILNIRDLDSQASEVPDHDFLFAGFPCQTFSSAGKKLGFLDEIKGTLFFDIAKILSKKKPKFILLENVKHIINHDNGKTWKLITKTLEDIGYIIPKKPLILSPHEFGIPQERSRVFIPGILESKLNTNKDNINYNFESFKKELTKNSFEKFLLKKNIEEKYILKYKKDKYLLNVFNAWAEFILKIKRKNNRTLPVIWAYEFNKDYNLDHLNPWKKKYIKDMREIYLLNKKFIDKWLKKYDVLNWKKREQKLEWQAGKDNFNMKDSFIQLRQSGIRCRAKTKFPTLVAMVQIPLIFDTKYNSWRYLTPRETANLQSFPSNYKIYNEIENSINNDFESYKQFGNSVNIKIVSMIQKYLLEYF